MKIKGTLDGNEVEVETGETEYLTAAQVAEGHVPKTVVAEQYTLTAEATRAAAAARTGAEADLLKSEEFLGRFADANTDALRERLDIKAPDTSAEVERITAQLMTQHVEPLKADLATEREFVTSVLGRTRSADVAEACVALGVKPDMIELLQTYYADRAGYTREHLGWFIKDGPDKFVITAEHKEGKAPYLTIAEDLAVKRGDQKFNGWFTDKVKPGVDFKGPGGPEDTDTETVEGLRNAIAKLEAKGEFAEAGPLKTKLARKVSTIKAE